MGVFEDVVIKARTAADYVGSKTEELMEVSKHRIAIAELEDKLEKEYAAVGRKVCASAKDQSDCSEFVREKVAEIGEMEKKLEELRVKLSQIKGLKKCPSCSMVNPEEANYCQKCGAKL